MNHYLLVYRRSTGRLEHFADLGTDYETALAQRFEREKQESGDLDVEVVVLSAESKEALQRTHGRYFKNLHELLTDLDRALPR